MVYVAAVPLVRFCRVGTAKDELVVPDPNVRASPDVVAVPTLVSLNPPSLMLAVGVVCPSFVIAVDRPVAKSAVSELNAVDEMTVPVTTGWPALLIWKVPLPL